MLESGLDLHVAAEALRLTCITGCRAAEGRLVRAGLLPRMTRVTDFGRHLELVRGSMTLGARNLRMMRIETPSGGGRMAERLALRLIVAEGAVTFLVTAEALGSRRVRTA
jgi:hypothetical protein